MRSSQKRRHKGERIYLTTVVHYCVLPVVFTRSSCYLEPTEDTFDPTKARTAVINPEAFSPTTTLSKSRRDYFAAPHL